MVTTNMGDFPVYHASKPVFFEEFFDLGKAETVSPFITADTRHWGANLTLKGSILAAFLLALSFGFSFNASLVPFSKFLLVCVYFFAGVPALIESVEDLLSLEINIDILMTLAAFSSVLIGSGMEGGLLLVLFALSGAMEDAVTTKAKSAISSLHKLSPTKATVIDASGKLVERSVKDISIGTLILIKASQIVPLDGEVVEGTSSLNLVHLTGESVPITKKPGDKVPAGARNLDGALTVRITHTSSDSTLAKIIELVTQAQESRPALQRRFDSLSQTYALTIIGLATLFALTLPWVVGIPFLGVQGGLYRALAFLIAASPCALIIAIPIAYLSGVSVCAKRGILLKGGVTLDALAGCKAAAFDKTGTLTTGNLTCTGITVVGVGASYFSNETVLSIAYALERNAMHPIARSIISYAEEKNIKPVQLREFKSIPGYGLAAEFELNNEWTSVFLGNPEFILGKMDKEAQTLNQEIEKYKKEGELVAVLLINQSLFLFHFQDTLRSNIKKTLMTLKNKWKMRLVMLTGDNKETARRVAEEVGITECYADLKPEDKLNYVSKISQESGLIMIGDGINDAPALARATVGICMGKVGSTAAIDAADVILLHDNIERMDWLVEKAHQTQRIVRQNLILATAAIIFASLPALGGFVPLWLAVIMHEGGTVLVGLNALRLLSR